MSSSRTTARALRRVGIALLAADFVGVTVYSFAVGAWQAHGGELVSSMVLGGTYGAVGALIATRRPEVPIGWLLLGCGVLWSVGLWTVWPEHIADTGGRLTGLAAFIADDNWLPWPLVAVPAIQLPLLLLPDGRLRSPRWRPAAIVAVGSMAVASLSLMLNPGSVDGFPTLHHPGIQSLHPLLVGTVIAAAVALFAVAVIGLAGLVREYRSAHGVERQQMRWLAAGGSGALLALATGAFTPQNGWGSAASSFGLACIPMSIGVAVLRYRLYDLGRLVSRTVSYVLLTVTLVAVYFCIAAVSGLVAGGGTLGVAAGTLVAAALFQPLRRRLQEVVDRRFNRARYDAVRTVDAFSAHLRETVSTESVLVELTQVTSRALQPATVSVWLSHHPV
jgi:hypothetical protein